MTPSGRAGVQSRRKWPRTGTALLRYLRAAALGRQEGLKSVVPEAGPGGVLGARAWGPGSGPLEATLS